MDATALKKNIKYQYVIQSVTCIDREDIHLLAQAMTKKRIHMVTTQNSLLQVKQ